MFVKIAVLSALRRPKRTALIILAIALSVFVMEFISGWVVGMRDRMRRKILEDSAHSDRGTESAARCTGSS